MALVNLVSGQSFRLVFEIADQAKKPCKITQTTFIQLLIKKFDIILYQFVCLCNFIS